MEARKYLLDRNKSQPICIHQRFTLHQHVPDSYKSSSKRMDALWELGFDSFAEFEGNNTGGKFEKGKAFPPPPIKYKGIKPLFWLLQSQWFNVLLSSCRCWKNGWAKLVPREKLVLCPCAVIDRHITWLVPPIIYYVIDIVHK